MQVELSLSSTAIRARIVTAIKFVAIPVILNYPVTVVVVLAVVVIAILLAVVVIVTILVIAVVIAVVVAATVNSKWPSRSRQKTRIKCPRNTQNCNR